MPYFAENVALYLAFVCCASAQGVITTVAGGGYVDNVPATLARLNGPQGLALDAQGNAYFGDGSRIRRVDHSTGFISTVAGFPGGTSEEGPADSVSIGPTALALDPTGNLFFISDLCLKKLDFATHAVSRIAGLPSCNGTAGGLGDATDLAVDRAGNVFVLDSFGFVRKVDASNGNISVYAQDLSRPSGIALDASGDLYVIENTTGHLLRVDAITGIITTVAGTGSSTSAGDGGPATAASFRNPFRLFIDKQNNIYVSEQGRVRKIQAGSGLIGTVVGSGSFVYNGEGIPALQAGIGPGQTAVDAAGNLWVADAGNQRLRILSAATGLVNTVAGTGPNGDGGPATGATLSSVSGVAVNPAGDVFIGEGGAIRRVDHVTGLISTFVGGSSVSADGSIEGSGMVPGRLAFDDAGDLLLTDINKVRIVRPGSQTAETIAGTGQAGFGGDGGPATAAQLSFPTGIAADRDGNIFIADSGNERVRRVDTRTGIITTVVGDGTGLFAGDGDLGGLEDVAIGKDGALYIGTTSHVLRLDGNGALSKLAGNGIGYECGGDGGPAKLAPLAAASIIFDSVGNVYVHSAGSITIANCGVRRIAQDSSIVQTVAGGGTQVMSESAPALSVQLKPRAIALQGDTLYIAEETTIRKVTPVMAPALPAPPHDFVVRDAATFSPSPISPGQLVSLTGNYLGPPTEGFLTIGSDGRVTNQLDGVQVFMDDIPAPLLYVSAAQINAVVPYGIALDADLSVRIRTQGGEASMTAGPVAPAFPTIFPGAVVNLDWTVNTASNPVPKKGTIIAFGTGIGTLVPAVQDGAVIHAPDLPRTQASFAAYIYQQGMLTQVQSAYIGAAPELVAGVMAAVLTLPDGLVGGPATFMFFSPVTHPSSGYSFFIRTGDAAPTLSSISPASPHTSFGIQDLVVSGTDFDIGLTVDLFYEGQFLSTISGNSVSRITPTSFWAGLDFSEKSGQFGIEAVNPGGKRSARFNFTVLP